MAVAGPCPDENALVQFARGQSDDGELARIEAHLDGCEACRRAVAAAASDETLSAGATPATLEMGALLGRYEVEGILGVGGMGVVYVGRDPRLGRRVALKRLRGETRADAHARLVREAQAMAQLSHPNVVPIFELGDDESGVFIAMELVDGVTLRDWLKQPRPPEEILDRFLEAGRGLAAAHAAGVVHRDFKPSNVLVGAEGRARVTDFGLARPVRASAAARPGDSDLTQQGTLVGTLAYMAPEQLRGEPSDARSDQFSFCAALAEALGGVRVFPGGTAAERLDAMRAPPRFGPSVRGPLRVALARGLSVDPAHRHASMENLLAALEAARRSDRTRLLLAGLVAALAVGLGATGLLLGRPPAPSPAPPPPVVVDLAARTVALAPGQLVEVDTAPLSMASSSDEAVARVAPSASGFTVHGVGVGVACLVVHEAGTERRLSVRVGGASGEPCAGPAPADGLPAVPPTADATIVVGAGEKTLVWIPGLRRVAISDASVADVATKDKGVLEVSGRAPGVATLSVWAGEERRQWKILVKAR